MSSVWTCNGDERMKDTDVWKLVVVPMLLNFRDHIRNHFTFSSTIILKVSLAVVESDCCYLKKKKKKKRTYGVMGRADRFKTWVRFPKVFFPKSFRI
jgi:hypothetical protein